jgi:hypothetical protein
MPSVILRKSLRIPEKCLDGGVVRLHLNSHSGDLNTDSGKSKKSVHLETRIGVQIEPEYSATLVYFASQGNLCLFTLSLAQKKTPVT